MLVVQMTDLHLGYDRPDATDGNVRRFADALVRLRAMRPAPDLLVLSGDLTEHGDPACYRLLAEMLAGVDVPVLLAVGNHDKRAGFAAHWPEQMAGGFVQHVHDAGPLRVIVLDTLEDGRHGGAFCDARASWLRARLAEASGRPTLLVLHHPPVQSGIPWIDPDPAEPWIARLEAEVAACPDVVALLAGHVHRPFATGWAGRPLVVSAPIAPELALEVAPLDPAEPDGRPLVAAAAAGWTVHRWDGAALVSLFASAQPAPVLATFDAATRPMVAGMMAERVIA